MSNIFGIEGRKQPARLTPHDMTLTEPELQALTDKLSSEAHELFNKGQKTAANARLDYRSAIFDRIADFQY
jgi:hypothetical protein